MCCDPVDSLRLARAMGREAAANGIVHDLFERFACPMHFPLHKVEDIGVKREGCAHEGIMMLGAEVVKMLSTTGLAIGERHRGKAGL